MIPSNQSKENYIHLHLNNDRTFIISQSDEKPKHQRSAIFTLDKIYKILNEGYMNLDESTSEITLEGLKLSAKRISEGYDSKFSKINWFLRFFYQSDANEVRDLKKKIDQKIKGLFASKYNQKHPIIKLPEELQRTILLEIPINHFMSHLKSFTCVAKMTEKMDLYLKNLFLNEVSKNKEDVLREIGRDHENLVKQLNFGHLKKFYLELKRRVGIVLSTHEHLSELEPEIKQLLESSTLWNLMKLKQILDASDAYIFWKLIQYDFKKISDLNDAINDGTMILVDDILKVKDWVSFQSVDELLTYKREIYDLWFVKNRDLLSKRNRIGYLLLWKYKLTSIPKEIGYLKNLERAYFGSNKISHLPKEINSCERLDVIYLDNNDLRDEPSVLSKRRYPVSCHLLNTPYHQKIVKSYKTKVALNHMFGDCYVFGFDLKDVCF